MKVLLSAYACEPHQGSEPGVGWNNAVGLARHHTVHILTTRTHRPAIEAELAACPVNNLRVTYVDPLGWVYDWSKKRKFPGSIYVHYYLWQIWAYFAGRTLHASIRFDLVHHLTYGKYSIPSFLSFLPAVFVWGPLGGAESAPKSFWRDFNSRGRIHEIARSIGQIIGELDPFVHLTARRSRMTWCKAEDTARRMRVLGAKNVSVMIESGLQPEEIATMAAYPIPEAKPVRFISMGRLLHWKGFYLGIRAFAQAAIPGAEYWILGDGPERNFLEAMARDLKIDQQVKFFGSLPRAECMTRLAECHVLVHPSLHDSGGWVCVEAMAAGRPVVCLDLGGPGVQVTEETGFKIAARDPEQTVRDLAAAMSRLASEPELRQAMGKSGRRLIAENYSWEAKTKKLAELYETAVGKPAAAPSI